MKLLAVALYNHRGSEAEPACLGLGAELSNFGYFQRGSVKEMLSFLSKTIVQRTAVGQRQTVKQEDYFCHVHVKDGGIAGVAVTDKDYPTIAAFSVVGKAIEEFLQLGDESWRTQTTDGTQALTVVEAAVTKYQVGVYGMRSSPCLTRPCTAAPTVKSLHSLHRQGLRTPSARRHPGSCMSAHVCVALWVFTPAPVFLTFSPRPPLHIRPMLPHAPLCRTLSRPTS